MFSFLNEYRLNEAIIKERGMKEICKLKHNFFFLSDYDIKEAIHIFNPFPDELYQFYREIGFGFLHINRGRIHRILDPQSLIFVNLQKDEYKRDKILAQSIKDGQLVFFDSQAYGYFSLGIDSTPKGNPVYYKGEMVESSLYHFINNIHNDKNYLKYMKNDAEEIIKKKNLIDQKNTRKVNKQSEVNVSPDKVPDNRKPKSPWLLEDDDNIIIS